MKVRTNRCSFFYFVFLGVFLLLQGACNQNGKMGFSFAQTSGTKESAISATMEASQQFDLSNERCLGEENRLLVYHYDGDKDGHGVEDRKQYLCSYDWQEKYGSLEKPDWVLSSKDCNDESPEISPDAVEVCNEDDIDEDCDGIIDPDIAYLDKDGDGFGNSDSSLKTADCQLPPKKKGKSYVFNNFDCNDKDAAIGEPDLYFVDDDGDGYGASGSESTSSCDPIEGYVLNDGDCEDGDASIQTTADNPDILEDKDCDEVDDRYDLCSATNSSLLSSSDADGDGCFGEEDCDDTVADEDKTMNADNDCDGTLASLDCDDNDPKNKSERTNPDDQDCDGILADNDCDDYDAKSETLATDADCDGVVTAEDCDDEDEDKPNYDEDCDGVSSSTDCDDRDEDEKSVASFWYPDRDGDGVGENGGKTYACLNSLDGNYLDSDGDDCDDNAFYTDGEDYEYYDDDSDCDSFCDAYGTSVELDSDCDGNCDSGVDISLDKDCDGICDNIGTLTKEDHNCNGKCDNIHDIPFHFFKGGALVICPPSYTLSSNGKCVVYCTDDSCAVGWADEEEDMDCSWDENNKCHAGGWEMSCIGSWPFSSWGAVAGSPKKFDESGKTIGGYDGNWRTEPLLVTADLFGEDWDPINIPFKDSNSFHNCLGDQCENIHNLFDPESEFVTCPYNFALNDEGYCEPKGGPLNIIETSDGTEVLCPPSYSLSEDETSCNLPCSQSYCPEDWPEDSGVTTDCSWDSSNSCDPRNYHTCFGKWPMTTFSYDYDGPRTFDEGGNYVNRASSEWDTSPLILPDGFVCE